MSTADGTVLGMTQIFGTAPHDGRSTSCSWPNATATQQNDFDKTCAAFVNTFRATPPFDELGPAISIFRVNVTSIDSGADDPIAAGGTGSTIRTYFDTTFGANKNRRLLVYNTSIALSLTFTAILKLPLAFSGFPAGGGVSKRGLRGIIMEVGDPPMHRPPGGPYA